MRWSGKGEAGECVSGMQYIMVQSGLRTWCSEHGSGE